MIDFIAELGSAIVGDPKPDRDNPAYLKKLF